MNKNEILMANARQIACSNPFERLAEKAVRNGEQRYMRVKMYPLIERLVEEGIEAGWSRAHKHTDTPYGDAIKDTIQRYIMQGFDETFEFNQEEE